MTNPPSTAEREPVRTFRIVARNAATLAALAALSLAPACSAPDEQVREARAEVQRALARGDLEVAREELARLRKSRPATPEAVQRLANLMVRVGEAPQALWLLEDGLQRFPERGDLRLHFARVALLLGEASRAKVVLEPIESDSLFHPDALVLRARATLELGDLEEALHILEEADELYPDLPAARRVHYDVLFQERRFEEALELVEEAKAQVASEEQLRELRILEARARGVMGNREEAVAILREIAEESPSSFGAWRMLVQALSGMDRRDEAFALVRSALDEDPEDLRLYPILTGLYIEAGQRDEAQKVIRRYIEVAQSPSAYMELVRFHSAVGDTEKVLVVTEEALEEFPDQPMLHTAHVQALLDLDRLDDVRVIIADMEAEAAEAGEQPGKAMDLEYLRARLELAEGDAESAAERLRKVATKFDRVDTQFHLGRALEELGDLGGAERAYRMAVRHARQAAEPLLALLRVAEKMKAPLVQRDAARRLLRFPEYRVLGFRRLIEAFLAIDNLESAEGVARRFVEQESDELDAYVLLARSLWRQERVDEAEQVLYDAEEQLGASPELTAERAAVLALADREDDGIAALERALEESPEDTELMQKLAALYFDKGKFKAGSTLIDRALELDPENPEPLRVRAMYAAAHGPLEVARRDAERYLEERPRDHEMHFRLGSIYVALELTDEAMEAYRRSAELAEGAFAPRNNLAVLYQEAGDLDAALDLAHEAYERAQDDPDVLDTLGWIYLERGLVDRAISVLQQSHEEAPGGLGSLHLALAYREAGRSDEAEDLLSNLVARADIPTDIRRQAANALRTP